MHIQQIEVTYSVHKSENKNQTHSSFIGVCTIKIIKLHVLSRKSQISTFVALLSMPQHLACPKIIE